VDYCFFFNICSGTHESEVCQVLTFRLNRHNSQLASSGLLALVCALQIYDFLSDRGTTYMLLRKTCAVIFVNFSDILSSFMLYLF